MNSYNFDRCSKRSNCKSYSQVEYQFDPNVRDLKFLNKEEISQSIMTALVYANHMRSFSVKMKIENTTNHTFQPCWSTNIECDYKHTTHRLRTIVDKDLTDPLHLNDDHCKEYYYGKSENKPEDYPKFLKPGVHFLNDLILNFGVCQFIPPGIHEMHYNFYINPKFELLEPINGNRSLFILAVDYDSTGFMHDIVEVRGIQRDTLYKTCN
jgi:hypothetical protein